MSRRRSGLTFYQKQKRMNSDLFHELVSWFFSILIVIFLGVAAVYFFGLQSTVVGFSMEPALAPSQEILINRVVYVFSTPKAGDVVLFLPNGNVNANYYTKRIVAVPGDRVQIISGVLYCNGEPSPYAATGISEAGIAEHEVVLENGEFFVMGDSPAAGEDSRSANIGPIHSSDIIGKVWYKKKMPGAEAGFVK